MSVATRHALRAALAELLGEQRQRLGRRCACRRTDARRPLPLRPAAGGPPITQRSGAGARTGIVSAPVLVAHHSDDRLVPPSIGRTLYERSRALTGLALAAGGSHPNTNGGGIGPCRAALAELFAGGRWH